MWKVFVYLLSSSAIGKLVRFFYHWIVRVIGTWLYWQPKQAIKISDVDVPKHTVQEQKKLISYFGTNVYICIQLGKNGQIITCKAPLLNSYMHNTFSTVK